MRFVFIIWIRILIMMNVRVSLMGYVCLDICEEYVLICGRLGFICCMFSKDGRWEVCANLNIASMLTRLWSGSLSIVFSHGHLTMLRTRTARSLLWRRSRITRIPCCSFLETRLSTTFPLPLQLRICGYVYMVLCGVENGILTF